MAAYMKGVQTLALVASCIRIYADITLNTAMELIAIKRY